MSKKNKRHPQSIHSRNSQKQVRRFSISPLERDYDFWKPFEDYNNLESPKRAEALKSLGIIESNPEFSGILTKSHFVIPGKTCFECQNCGECCRYAKKIANLTYEPCLYLNQENTCSKHDKSYLICKYFPFWIYYSPAGSLLTIKPYCSGYGRGEPIDYKKTLDYIENLANEKLIKNDGAVIIHEVLMIPGRKDWAFPSKKNIDELMIYIVNESQKAGSSNDPIIEKAKNNVTDNQIEKPGEIEHAYSFTSGLLGGINDPMLTINENGFITDINENAIKLFKRERTQLIGAQLSSLFVNPDRVTSSIVSCFSYGKETASAQRLLFSDESTQYVLLNAIIFRDKSDGLIHGLLIGFTTITTAIYSEISHSKNYARGLLEASLDALMVIDYDSSIIDVNEMVVTLTGIKREKLIGSLFKDLFFDQKKAIDGVEITFKNGSVHNFELSMLRTEGEPIPVSFNATLFHDSDGVVQGIFASARDIRHRLKLVHELEEAKNYARGLIECCMDLMVTINRRGIITDVNNAATEITGLPRDKIIGTPFKNLFDDPDRATSGVEMTFTEGAVKNYEMNILSSPGQIIPISFNATLYRDSKGVVQGVFAIAREKN